MSFKLYHNKYLLAMKLIRWHSGTAGSLAASAPGSSVLLFVCMAIRSHTDVLFVYLFSLGSQGSLVSPEQES